MEEIEGRIFVSIFTSSTITVFLRVFSFGCGNFFSFGKVCERREWKVKIAKSKSWVARYLEELPVLMAIVKV